MSHELVVQQSSRAIALAPSSYAEAITVAEMMSKANLIPQYLKGSPSDCLAIVLQAARWEMDPYAVAQKTSVIQGKLMHEGQLIAAVINSRGDLEEDLDYQFSGEGTSRELKVVGQRKGWKKPRDIDLTYKQAMEINKNGQMGKNPDQQMCYIGARIWGRRHMPQLMLGVYDPSEMSLDGNGENGGDPTPPARNTPPPKTKGVAGARDLKNVTPQPGDNQEEQKPDEPPETKQAPNSDSPPPNVGVGKPGDPELPRYLMGGNFPFEAQGKTYHDVKITGEDGNTLTAYWASDPKWLPAAGAYARLRLESKKSSKSGQADKLFITEIHPE